MARDGWAVGPDGTVHLAFGGAGWACRNGRGGVIVGDVVDDGATPYGACRDCLGAVATRARAEASRAAADEAWSTATSEGGKPDADRSPTLRSTREVDGPPVDAAFAEPDEPAFDPDLAPEGAT